MIGLLISLMITVIIVGLLYWAITLLPIPQPFQKIVLVLFILIVVLWLIGYLGVYGPGPWWGYPRH